MIEFIGLVPTVLWLMFFNKVDRGQKEPTYEVARVVFLGGIGAGLVVIFNQLTQLGQSSMLLAVTSEELVKTLAILAGAYATANFNELNDGFLYAAAAALGFAGAENILYFLTAPDSTVIRLLLTPIAHVVFTGMMGYALIKYKLHKSGFWILPAGFSLSVLFHYLYNVAISANIVVGVIVWMLELLIYFTLFVTTLRVARGGRVISDKELKDNDPVEIYNEFSDGKSNTNQ